MGTKGWAALRLSLLVVACCSCASNEESGKSDAGRVYSRYNIHYFSKRGANIASYANYTDCPNHAVLPYNTAFKVGSWRGGFKLRAADTGLVILFEYKTAGTRGMSVEDYIRLILSPSPVTYEGLSEVDRQGIQAGKAMVGMSKEGVKIALGYPALHQTSSLEENRWVYWKGRLNTLVVNFGDNGKVGSIK
jgi:hypothetical protein